MFNHQFAPYNFLAYYLSRPVVQLLFAFLLIQSSIFSLYSQTLTSQLWGEHGELWDPPNSPLGDFSNVGYMNGDVPIPDWPVGVDVTDYGAVPNDAIDDSQAFIDAIAACPDYHAVFVPNGRYIIEQQIIPERDHFVLRGEDMYETVLFFPKNLNEIYIQENGWSENLKTTGHPKGFFRVEAGTERSIESLTFEFREQRKMGHWEHKGADAIYYGGTAEHSWVRNIYIKNADHGIMMGGAEHISFLNLVFDHYIGRPDIIGSSGITRWVGHIGVNMGNAQNCLFHNVDFKGKYFHDFDIINVPKGCVVSNVKGLAVVLHHHGQGASNNLYTNVNVGGNEQFINNVGVKTVADSNRQKNETHWRIYGDVPLDPEHIPLDTQNNHVFVGYGADVPTAITSTLWQENIDPSQLVPQNIYLAQLEYFGKPLPEPAPPEPPSPYLGDLIRINPTDSKSTSSSSPDTVQSGSDLNTGQDSFLKFDLTGIPMDSVARARLRLNLARFRTEVEIGVWSVSDDDWTEDALTYNNQPDFISELDSYEITGAHEDIQFEMDVTAFVQQECVGGDQVVTLALRKKSGNGFITSLRGRQSGLAPELIIEKVPDPLPGAPSAPRGIRTEGIVGNIVLDWEDNPEADGITYNVYRTYSLDGGRENSAPYAEPIATGLLSSHYVDIDSTGNWRPGGMHHDRVFRYKVTAVDAFGNESELSSEAFGTTLSPLSSPPAFAFSTFDLGEVTESEPFNRDLNALVADPEDDPLYFYKISGPEWLTVIEEGSISGTPSLSDSGKNEFIVQVNSLGGRDEAVFEILVDAGPVAPGLPNPSGNTVARAGDGAVFLEWSDSSDIDFSSYSIYRSTQSGSYGVPLVQGLTSNTFLDREVENGTTYFYTFRTFDTSGNGSLLSHEVVATPSPDNVVAVADYTFDGGSLNSSDSDTATTATDLNEGGGLSITFENRSFGEPGTFGNPRPSLKWSNNNANNGVILDDDYLSFTVTVDSGEAYLHSFSFDEKGGDSDFLALFSSQEGFLSVEDQVVGPKEMRLDGIVYTHTLWLDGLAQLSEAEEIEVRLYMDKDKTIGETWVDNLRLTRIKEPGEATLGQIAPSGLVASVSGTSIQLDWDDHPGQDLASYQVFRSTQSGNYGIPLEVDLEESQFTDNDLVPGTTYFYTISAVGVDSTISPKSAEASAQALGTSPGFTADTIELPSALVGLDYRETLRRVVRGGDPKDWTFNLLGGPSWLTVMPDGTLSGQPSIDDVGVNVWTAQVSSEASINHQASLRIAVSKEFNPGLDIDFDRMEDIWEMTYFGSTGNVDGAADSDFDGTRDYFEYLYGSAPNDAVSRGVRVAAERKDGATRFGWKVADGFVLGTDYLVQVSADLSHWEILPPEHYTLNQGSAEGMTSLEIEVTENYGEYLFIRLVRP